MDIIKNLFHKQRGTGANIDTRPEEERAKDYEFREIVASASPVVWTEKSQSSWRKFPIFNQNGSNSCVAQTLAKLLGVMYWLANGVYIHFSATHIYQRRSNSPTPGMGGVDAFNIARKSVTLEELAPSQNMTDAQMDAAQIAEYKKKVGEIFKLGNFIILPVRDIETVASVIQTTGKAVMIWFYFKIDEWTTQPTMKYPTLDAVAPDTIRHSITGVDYALVNGKKAIIADDSWGTSYGAAGQRVLDEDFFKERNFFAAYPMNFAFEVPQLDKPQHTFLIDLEFGQTSDEVKALQDCLRWEGLFPSNAESTGYFGSITKKSVITFQAKYGINPVGRVGPVTRQKLNEIYGQ